METRRYLAVSESGKQAFADTLPAVETAAMMLARAERNTDVAYYELVSGEWKHIGSMMITRSGR